MQRYGGFIYEGFRYVTYFPTTVYDSKVVQIKVYHGKRLIDKEIFGIRRMPEWNPAYQVLQLSKRDTETLEKKTKELMKKYGHRR